MKKIEAIIRKTKFEAVEEAVHRALLQRQGLAYLKGLVRAVGAEEFQNVENFL